VSDEAYHLRSIRCAVVRETLGGASAVDSHLFQGAVAALIAMGLSESEIVEKARVACEGVLLL
jgi:hypothetical protein